MLTQSICTKAFNESTAAVSSTSKKKMQICESLNTEHYFDISDVDEDNSDNDFRPSSVPSCFRRRKLSKPQQQKTKTTPLHEKPQLETKSSNNKPLAKKKACNYEKE